MAEEGGSGSTSKGLGAAAIAVCAVLGSFADDCARLAGPLAGAGDDLARVAATQADDLARVTSTTSALGDDASRLGSGAASMSDDVVVDVTMLDAPPVALDDVAGHLGDVHLSPELAQDVVEVGLDVADLALDVTDAAGDADGADSEAPRPRLLEAGRSSPPATSPFDPLVLLVTEDDDARVRRLASACATADHACLVLACPPGPRSVACQDAWRGAFAAAAGGPADVRPEPFVAALLVRGVPLPATLGTRHALGPKAGGTAASEGR